jgi:hypothetical protein
MDQEALNPFIRINGEPLSSKPARAPRCALCATCINQPSIGEPCSSCVDGSKFEAAHGNEEKA